jgi:putative transposase
MKIKEELRVNNLSAMRSLNEGLEETLSLHKLGLFDKLGISLKTTNCIESVFSMVGRTCKRISNWKNSSQKHRWMATCLLDIETRMRRVRGYKHLPLLRERIKNKLGIKEVNKAV